MTKTSATMHMIGRCKTNDELESTKGNIIAFLNVEDKAYNKTISIDDCCKDAETWLKNLLSNYKDFTLILDNTSVGISAGIIRIIDKIETDYYISMHSDCLIKYPFIKKNIALFNDNIVTMHGLDINLKHNDSWCVIHKTDKLKLAIETMDKKEIERKKNKSYKEDLPVLYAKYSTIYSCLIAKYGLNALCGNIDINNSIEHSFWARYKRGTKYYK